MYMLTFAVLASALLVLIIQLITGTPLPPNFKNGPFIEGDLEMGKKEQPYNKCAFLTFTVMRYLVLFALYGGIAAVILGILSYKPAGNQKFSDLEPAAPAIMCAMTLTVVFFTSQFIIAICRTYLELTRVNFPQVVGMIHAAQTMTDLAPMLAVLFLGCHMRALQHDAQPQDWAQSCMLSSTGATCVMSLLAIMVPLTLGGVLKTNPWTNEVVVEVPSPTLGYIFMTLRYLCMVCVHGGAAGVMISIFAFESPGPMATMPVSPSLQCVVNLTAQFFFVYFVMTIMLTVSELTGGTIPMEKWSMYSAVEAARATLALAPVLSLLFVATCLQGFSLTEENGVLHSWVQGAMYVSTWSLQVSGLMCLAAGLVMSPVETDSEGKVAQTFLKWHAGIAMVALRYTAMLLLYGGLLVVMIGMFTMTPDGANSFKASAILSRAYH